MLMKKTFITSLISLACAASASAGAVGTLTNTTDDTNQAGYTGFDFTLNADWLTASEGLTLNPTVELSGITIETANTWYRNNPMGIALFEKVDSTWNFVGKSDWKTSAPVGDNTFTFDNLALSSTTTYTAVFYGNAQAFSELAATSTLSGISSSSANISQNPTYEAPLVSAGIRLTSTTNSETLYTWNGTSSGTYAPKVSFSVVPEPATATLSLLALAGLAARRRRK